MLHPVLFLLVIASLALAGCSESTKSELSISVNSKNQMQLSPPDLLLDSRMINQELLFAEVTISYSDISVAVIADRPANTDSWIAQLQVPTQTAFEISVIWFDLLDQQRLDLVRTDNSFQPIEFPGQLSIVSHFSDYTSDDFDADSDSIVNLTERLNGTSPFDASSPSNDPPSTANPIVDGYEFINVADGAVTVLSNDDDTAPVAVVQTTPVINSTVPVSVNTPITLFFDDKLFFESLLGNVLVLENNQKINGTFTISESANGFAIISFSPLQPYQDGATISLRFTGGEAGVLDDSGNRLVGNVGDDFEISITTIDQNAGSFDNNLSFENFNDGVVFAGDGAVLTGNLGCLGANAGSNFAAISTGGFIVSNGSALQDTTSNIQIGPISLENGATTIAFDYNFVTDEYPNFLGSIFDDSSVLSISGPNGTFTDVLTTVNSIGEEGFSPCVGVTGIADTAGQTGWRSQSINFGNIGSPIFITFTVTDVEDSSFSSILAIDNFRL